MKYVSRCQLFKLPKWTIFVVPKHKDAHVRPLSTYLIAEAFSQFRCSLLRKHMKQQKEQESLIFYGFFVGKKNSMKDKNGEATMGMHVVKMSVIG